MNMDNTQANGYKQIILKILEAIDYADDKESFVNEFSGTIYMQSVIGLIQSKPIDEQEQIKQELNNLGNDAEQIEHTLKTHFTEDQRIRAVETAAKNTLINYFNEIDGSLSATQTQKVAECLLGLESTAT